VLDEVFGCGKMVGDGFRRVAGEPTDAFSARSRRRRHRVGAAMRHAIPLDAVGRLGQLRARRCVEQELEGRPPFQGHRPRHRRRAPRPQYQRLELIKFNLLDNSGTYPGYVRGWQTGHIPNVWNEMRLPKGDPHYAAVGGDGEQHCKNELVRFRNLTGICNDTRNPAMGSSNSLLGRNVDFSSTFPELGDDELTRNRHGDRIGLMTPDPQVISRRLFTRPQSHPELCANGLGLDGDSTQARCDYQKAPFMNVNGGLLDPIHDPRLVLAHE
jgi:hypothetical protein